MSITGRIRTIFGVAAARRELPRILRQVAQGGWAVAIGPRGRPAAVLLGAEEYERLKSPRGKSSGWDRLRLEPLVSGSLEEDLRALRHERGGALAVRSKRYGAKSRG